MEDHQDSQFYVHFVRISTIPPKLFAGVRESNRLFVTLHVFTTVGWIRLTLAVLRCLQLKRVLVARKRSTHSSTNLLGASLDSACRQRDK